MWLFTQVLIPHSLTLVGRVPLFCPMTLSIGSRVFVGLALLSATSLRSGSDILQIGLTTIGHRVRSHHIGNTMASIFPSIQEVNDEPESQDVRGYDKDCERHLSLGDTDGRSKYGPEVLN
jgi:hypothetical protein